jgi:site-specific DNA-methyltransferase (adenine-specific)
MLAFGGSRMFHRLACGMEDAGFEIRDVIGWIYSQGFPAGVDISKAIDKSLGVEPTLTKFHKFGTNAPGLGKGMGTGKSQKLKLAITIPTSEEAKPWHNWHTALKPSFEPCVVGRKPLAGTVHANVMEYGTGGLNIGSTYPEKKVSEYQQEDVLDEIEDTSVSVLADIDRWPPNVVFGHSIHCDLMGCAPGCQYRELQIQTTTAEVFPAFRHNSKAKGSERPKIQLEDGEMLHTTVKPYELIRWLVKLVTPLGGTVLEPFAGSGTAVQICLTDGFNCVAIERDADYMNLIRARLDEIPGLEIEEADDDLAGTSPHS